MMTKFLVTLLILISGSSLGQLIVNGTITDQATGEQLLFASIYDEQTGISAVTNEYGYFSISLPTDTVTLTIDYVGYEIKKITAHKGNLQQLNFSLIKTSEDIDVVEITMNRTPQEELHNSTQMSAINIPIKDIKYIPSIGGESDVIKVIQLMPGVQKGGEGGTGMYVRGGDVDQNLVILDEAVIYNIGHLFGFFSVFNQDAIKDMTLYKGAFPSKYGGRLSSVLDIRMDEGNKNEFHAKGGVGLLSSRFMVTGPLVKDKASFMVAGRRTYIDQVFKWTGQFLPYYFYDLNAKINYEIDDKNHIYFSSYIGNDILAFDQGDIKDDAFIDFGFVHGNITSTLRWNRIINERKFANFSLIYTNFDYNINGDIEDNSIYISSAINDYGIKADYEYFHSNNHKFKYGASGVFHEFRPNVINSQGNLAEQIVEAEKGDIIGTFESGVYLQHIYKKDSSDWAFSTGARLSSVLVKEKAYGAIEPRLSAKYNLDSNSNVKFSYSNMRQYMHLVSSSTVALPTDLWYPVTKDVKPQSSHQFAAGYSYFSQKIKSLISVEGYYKYMTNLTEYKEGSNLLLNDDFEADLLQGTGKSYGVEFLIKKDQGIWNGWIGYTLAWSTRKFKGLNGGQQFPSKYDRRHNISVVQNIKLNKRWHIGAVWVFSTGSRFTPQVGVYALPNASSTNVDLIPVYTSRNEVVLSSSHRLDINFVWKSKENRKFRGEWHFGAYNVYNRATPWRIEVVPTDNGFKYVQPGLFGIIPSVAYNFEF